MLRPLSVLLLTLSLTGCGVLSLGPQVSTTGSIAPYTQSFDDAAPGGASYSRPAVDLGFTGTIGFFSATPDGASGETGGQFAVGFFQGDNTVSATATNPEGTVVEEVSLRNADRGVEAHVGLGESIGPLAGLAVFRRGVTATREGQFGTEVVKGSAFVVRPEVGVFKMFDSFGVQASIGYDIPLFKNDPVLASAFDPSRQDLGERPIRAGQSGFVGSVRLRI